MSFIEVTASSEMDVNDTSMAEFLIFMEIKNGKQHR
jgi:hypothetical protein